ncbi:MAG: SHOCT domain-containing protein [Solirubrobacterales bacterium]
MLELVTADFTFGQALLTVLEIFLFVAWFWILISVVGDLFTDHGVSGWGKAGWILLLLILPFLGLLIYLIARGGSMHERVAKREAEAKQEFDSYIRHTAAPSPAEEISKLAALRDQGTISAAEFDQMKAKLLA